MAHVISTVATTATALAFTYGAGATNTAIGAGLGHSLGKRVKRIDAQIETYKSLQETAAKALLQPLQEPEKNDADAPEPESPHSYQPIGKNDPYTPVVDKTIKKIETIQREHATYAKATRQLKQLKQARIVDRANQASAYAQLATGGAQVAVATSSIGHATGAVMNLVIGFSFFSSILYLGASIYGFAVATKQLSENKRKQEEIRTTIMTITHLPKTTGDIESLKGVEKAALEKTLAALQVEEAFLVQQRNAQAINIVAALLGIAAMCLFTVGTQGIGVIAYYALLAASVLLPLVAMGYTQCSMNETKYMKELLYLLNAAPALPFLPHKADPDAVANLQLVLLPLLSLDIYDNQTRKDLKNLVEELNSNLDMLDEQGREVRVESLKKLFGHLIKLQQVLIAEDLRCRLKIAGMGVEDLEPPAPTEDPELRTPLLKGDKTARTEEAVSYLKDAITGVDVVPDLSQLIGPLVTVI